jgi:hypothetical protein
MKLGSFLASLMIIIGCTPGTSDVTEKEAVVRGNLTSIKVIKLNGSVMSLDIGKKQALKLLEKLDK